MKLNYYNKDEACMALILALSDTLTFRNEGFFAYELDERVTNIVTHASLTFGDDLAASRCEIVVSVANSKLFNACCFSVKMRDLDSSRCVSSDASETISFAQCLMDIGAAYSFWQASRAWSEVPHA